MVTPTVRTATRGIERVATTGMAWPALMIHIQPRG